MRSKKIILDKCPMYMSLAAIHLSSHGDPGKIYLTEKEKDFFEPNQTTETGINELEFNSTDRFYFLKSNIKKYLKEFKDEYFNNELHYYKKNHSNPLKEVSKKGYEARINWLDSLDEQLYFSPYIKISTKSRYFIYCNDKKYYDLIVKYSIIPCYTSILIKKKRNELGGNDFCFELRKNSDVEIADEYNKSIDVLTNKWKNQSLKELYKKTKDINKKCKKNTNINFYYRDQKVCSFVKLRAKGKCDLCNKPAPFIMENGVPYLEEHHVIPLNEGGDDSINNAVALCPNCHRKIHSLKDQKDINKLKIVIEKYQNYYNLE